MLAAAWVLVALRTPPLFRGDASAAISLGWLKRDRFMWLLGGLLFVGMGIFNAVATWLDPILAHFHHGSASGYLFAVLTGAGVLGAAVLPEAAATRDRRRAMLEVTVGVTAVAFGYLRQALDLTAGNLSRHLTVLEDAGLVQVSKGYEGRRPRTWVKITTDGRAALTAEIAALTELVRRHDGNGSA